MKFKFNGGRGAILCSKCGVILYEGRQIPQEVWDAIDEGKDTRDLPDYYCEDGCERSMKVLAEMENKGKEDDTYRSGIPLG